MLDARRRRSETPEEEPADESEYDRVKQSLGEAAVVLGSASDDRVHLIANFTSGAVARGAKAGDVVRVAAKVAGGGGGGRDTMAQAGGRDPAKLPDAIAAARIELQRVLG